MPINDGSKPRGFWLQVQAIKGVQDIDRKPFHFKDVGLGKLDRRGPVVNIAAHRSHRRKLLQSVQDRAIPNVARMKDVVRSSQCL